MHSKSDNIEIMISYEGDEVMKNLFDSIKNRYQNNSGSMRNHELVIDYVKLLCYKFHKINLNRGVSYTDSILILSGLHKKQKRKTKSYQ